MKKTIKGFTIVEMVVVMVIATTFSIGLHYIFLSSTKNINGEEVLYEVKSYANESIEIISDKIRNADQIGINTQFGSIVITVTNNIATGQEVFVYNIMNNIIHENGVPMKLFGHHWLQNQNLYEVEINMNCSTVTSSDTNDSKLRQNIYDLDITANIQSKLNENYEVSHKSSNRIFAINIFSKIVNNQDSDEG